MTPHSRGRAHAYAVALALALLLPGAARAGDPTADATARLLRDATLRTLDGRTLAMSRLRGQVVVVNFWASWCAPCRRELPALDALNAKLAREGGTVIAVSIDERADNARRFVDANHLSLTVAHDGPDHLAKQLDLPSVPYTVVLDRDGRVALTISGAELGALDRLASVTRELAAKPALANDAPGGDR